MHSINILFPKIKQLLFFVVRVIHCGYKRLSGTVNIHCGVSINNGFERAMFYRLSKTHVLNVLCSPCACSFWSNLLLRHVFLITRADYFRAFRPFYLSENSVIVRLPRKRKIRCLFKYM